MSPASAEDLGRVEALLAAASLPKEGLADQFPTAYVVAYQGAELVAAAGLERYGRVGLLRSVVVAESARARGIGRALVQDRLTLARETGLERVFLLTTTAGSYFEILGFERVSRDGVPEELARSPEFASACPASATCLALQP